MYGVYSRHALKSERRKKKRSDARMLAADPVIVAPPLSVNALIQPVVVPTKMSYSSVAAIPKPVSVPHAGYYSRVNELLFGENLIVYCVSPSTYAVRVDVHTLDPLKPMVVVETTTQHSGEKTLDLSKGGTDWKCIHIRKSSSPPAEVASKDAAQFAMVKLAAAASVPLVKKNIKPEYSEYEIDDSYVTLRERQPSALHKAIRELEDAMQSKLRVRLYHAKKGHVSNATEFAARGTLASALNTQDTSLVFVAKQ